MVVFALQVRGGLKNFLSLRCSILRIVRFYPISVSLVVELCTQGQSLSLNE